MSVLRSELNVGYLPQPIPSIRDEEIQALLLKLISNKVLARLLHSLQDDHRLVLRAFAERMASRAVRDKKVEYLEIGLVALLLSWNGSDSRDELTVLPLMYDAAVRLGLDVRASFESLRQLVGDRLVNPLDQFLSRKEEEKSLASMGYSAERDKDGFRYVRNW